MGEENKAQNNLGSLQGRHRRMCMGYFEQEVLVKEIKDSIVSKKS